MRIALSVVLLICSAPALAVPINIEFSSLIGSDSIPVLASQLSLQNPSAYTLSIALDSNIAGTSIGTSGIRFAQASSVLDINGQQLNSVSSGIDIFKATGSATRDEVSLWANFIPSTDPMTANSLLTTSLRVLVSFRDTSATAVDLNNFSTASAIATVFHAGDFDARLSSVSYGRRNVGNVLELSRSNNLGTLIVQNHSVPEPGSIALMVVACLSAGVIWHLRRKICGIDRVPNSLKTSDIAL